MQGKEIMNWWFIWEVAVGIFLGMWAFMLTFVLLMNQVNALSEWASRKGKHDTG